MLLPLDERSILTTVSLTDELTLTDEHELTLTDELKLFLSTDLQPSTTLKLEAVAGAGKSTALHLFSAIHAPKRILYLTFSKAEAEAKLLDYAKSTMGHVTVSTRAASTA